MRVPWFIRATGYAIADHIKALVITIVALPFIGLVIVGSLAFVSPGNLIATPSGPHATANQITPPASTTPLDVYTNEVLSVLPGPTTYQDTDVAAELCEATLASVPAQLLPELSASRSAVSGGATTTLSVLGYGPGLGALALSDELALLDSCEPTYATEQTLTGQATGVADYVVTDRTADTTLYEIIVRRGDVLVVASLSAPQSTTPTVSTGLPATTTPSSTSSLSSLSSFIQSALSAGAATLQSDCVDPTAPLSAANYNPNQPGYKFPTRSVTLRAPLNWSLPDRSLLSDPLPTVGTYPVGSVTTQPANPTMPTYLTTVTAQVPTAASTGPGCGWEFAGMAVPNPSPSVVVAARKAALAPLHASWNAWPTEVASYLYDVALYQAKEFSYNQWLQIQSSTTTTFPVPTTTSTTTTTTTPTTTSTTSTTTTTGP